MAEGKAKAQLTIAGAEAQAIRLKGDALRANPEHHAHDGGGEMERSAARVYRWWIDALDPVATGEVTPGRRRSDPLPPFLCMRRSS